MAVHSGHSLFLRTRAAWGRGWLAACQCRAGVLRVWSRYPWAGDSDGESSTGLGLQVDPAQCSARTSRAAGSAFKLHRYCHRGAAFTDADRAWARPLSQCASGAQGQPEP